MPKVEFKMPRLGESITEAAIIKWFKNIGDTIEEDEILLEVATDKVDSEVPSTVSGVIKEILYKQNDVIEIGKTIAIIETDGTTSPSEKKNKKQLRFKNEGNKKTKKEEITYQVPSKFSKAKSNIFISPIIVSIER